MLSIVLPTWENLSFRRTLYNDPATMTYNAPWFPPDGCIPFQEEAWDAWLARWTGHEPERFCGFLANEAGALVGEVCWYEYGAGMGIVVLASQRGKGYATEGLRLLVERAFAHPEIRALTNEFEAERTAALAVHRKLGFAVTGEQDGVLTLTLMKEE